MTEESTGCEVAVEDEVIDPATSKNSAVVDNSPEHESDQPLGNVI
jgi:hypothetical protein